MQRLTYTRPHALATLHDELLAALPALAGATDGQPLLRVEGRGDEITLTIPDGVDRAAVEAVVTAHRRPARRRPKQPHEYAAEWAGATQARRLQIVARLLGIDAVELVDEP